MFDCPEQIQTSPMRMSFKVIVSLGLPEMVIDWPLALAGRGASLSFQRPWALEVAFWVWPAKDTVTSVPGSVQPHTGLARFR